MPYVANLDQDNEDETQQGEKPAGVPIQTVAGNSSVIDPQASTASATPNAPKNQGGGTFTDISKYIDQNRGQSVNLGQQVSSNLSGQGNNAKSTLNQQQEVFNDQVSNSEVKLNQDVLNQAKTNPVNLVQDQNNLDQFKKMRDANYKGPTSFEGSDFSKPVMDAFSRFSNSKDLSQTESGRMELIREMNQGKNSSKGNLMLDNLLLQSSDPAKQILDSTRNTYSDLDSRLQGVNADSKTRADQAKLNTTESANAVQSLLYGDTGLLPSFETDLNTRLEQVRKSATDKQNKITNDLGDNAYSLDEDLLGEFGIQDGSYSYGLDPSSYVNQANINNINRSNVASAEDYARSSALAQLAGLQQGVLNPEDINQAGSASQFAPKVDKDRLTQDLQKRVQDFDQLYNVNKVDVGPDSTFFNEVIYHPQMTELGIRTYRNHYSKFSPKELEAEADRLRGIGQAGTTEMGNKITAYLKNLRESTLGNQFKKNQQG